MGLHAPSACVFPVTHTIYIRNIYACLAVIKVASIINYLISGSDSSWPPDVRVSARPSTKQAALDLLRQRSLRRRSFSLGKGDDTDEAESEANARPQSANQLTPMQIMQEARRRSEDGACTPSKTSLQVLARANWPKSLLACGPQTDLAAASCCQGRCQPVHAHNSMDLLQHARGSWHRVLCACAQTLCTL